jgi:hypothetical protein
MGIWNYILKTTLATIALFLVCFSSAWSADYKEAIEPYVKKPLFQPAEMAHMQGPAKCPKKFRALMLNGKLRCLRCPPGFHFKNNQPKGGCFKCPIGLHLDRHQGKLRCVGCPKGAAYMGVCCPVKPICRCLDGKVFRQINGKWQCTDL